MTTPPAEPNTAVFPGSSSPAFTFTSPWRLRFPAALPTVSLSALVTSPLVNNAVNAQLIHSWGGERPIQFILHIKGLKCSTVIWRRRLLAPSICQEDHTQRVTKSMPAIWKTEGQAPQANKQGGAYQYYDKLMTVSVTTTSWIELLMASLCRSAEKKSAGKDLRGQASCVPKSDTHDLVKKKYYLQKVLLT